MFIELSTTDKQLVTVNVLHVVEVVDFVRYTEIWVTNGNTICVEQSYSKVTTMLAQAIQ